MADHVLNQSPVRRFLTLEPALIRAVVTALVLSAAIWGLDLADLGDRVTKTVELLYPAIVLVGGWWTRSAVTPSVKVVQTVEANGDIVAGPASPLPTGLILARPVNDVTFDGEIRVGGRHALEDEADAQAVGNDREIFPYSSEG